MTRRLSKEERKERKEISRGSVDPSLSLAPASSSLIPRMPTLLSTSSLPYHPRGSHIDPDPIPLPCPVAYYPVEPHLEVAP